MSYLNKNNFFGIQFCPVCKTDLKRTAVDGTERLVCPSPQCSYIYYHNPAPAAGALVINKNKLLLVKRAHEPMKNMWSLPSGFMEWDEHPSQTAIREIEEETGLRVELTSLFNVYSGNDDPRTNAVLILYLAKVSGGELLAADDAIEVDYFELDNIPKEIAFKSHRKAIADYLSGR